MGDVSMSPVSHPRLTAVRHGAISFDAAFGPMSPMSHLRDAPVREREIAYVEGCSVCKNLRASCACFVGETSEIIIIISFRPSLAMSHHGETSVRHGRHGVQSALWRQLESLGH